MNDFTAPISKATLLEDRAFVTRAGKIQLPQGTSAWKLANVSPVIADKTLSAQLSSGRVVHVRVERFKEAVPKPEEEPEEAIRERSRKQRELQTEAQLVGQELQSANRLLAQLLQEIGVEVAWGKADAESWAQQIEELRQWKLELVLRRDRLSEEQQELLRPKSKGSTQILQAPKLRADLILEVESEQAGEAEVVLEYAVPGACWRPYHTAVLEGEKLEFRCDGCVWQNTGEDWEDVELLFSTQRPSLGAEPPPLPIDTLAARKKAAETVVKERDAEIAELVVEGEPGPRKQRLAPEVPGIDDGGEAINLRALSRARVLSDGLPVRIELFKFSAEPQIERILQAEVCKDVILRTTQKNGASRAILAGPVDLVREAGLVGRGSTLYVAAGEPFQLGWGPVSSLRAQRRTDKSDEEKDDMMGGWFKVNHTVWVTLSNLSQESLTVKVTERIPVSELKQVEVVFDGKKTSEGAQPDANGFVTWNVELGPRGRKELKLAYALRRRKEVVGLT